MPLAVPFLSYGFWVEFKTDVLDADIIPILLNKSTDDSYSFLNVFQCKGLG